MLNRLLDMFRGNHAGRRHAAPISRKESFARLNAVAPLESEINNSPVHSAVEQDSGQPCKPLVYREAVLGNDQRVAGYAFRLRYKVSERVREASTNVQRLYDGVLLRNLQIMEIQRLLEHRLAFIDVSVSSLGMPLLEELPPQGTVYVIRPNLQSEVERKSCLTRLGRLKSKGYRIGLRDTATDTTGILPFLELADFLFIDIASHDIPAIRDQLGNASGTGSTVKFAAANIQSLDDLSVCTRMPFSFYQGSFVTSRESWNTPRMDASRIKVLELLNKLRGDADALELVILIKQDPALSFRLLRFINSPGMGLLHKIGTLDQALIVLGRQKLFRWLTLLLFTSGQTRALDWAIMENALVRARFAELIAQDSLSPDERDELFVAGLFSLMDVLLAIPMDDVLRQVSLPPQVSDVLLLHHGKYAPYLNLAIACEQSDDESISTLSRAVGMDEIVVNKFHAEALLWAVQVGK